jgi:hypothetical protein
VATRQLRDLGDEIPVLVLFNDDRKFFFHVFFIFRDVTSILETIMRAYKCNAFRRSLVLHLKLMP